MDLAAIGLAAAQAASTQRAQQSGVSAIKQQHLQTQTFVSLMSEALGAKAPTPVGPDRKNDPGAGGDTPDRRLPRGSLVNILT